MKVKLVYNISNAVDGSIYVLLVKTITLPFVPQKGLELLDERSLHITHVAYSNKQSIFVCSIGTCKCYSDREINDEVSSRLKAGWKISKDMRKDK